MEMQELERQYQARTDEELLRLALESEQLTPEAQVQLHTELAKRGISKSGREDFRAKKSDTGTEPTEGSKITFLFPSLRWLAETLRDWKRYKSQTGEWPALSIFAYVVHGIVLLSCAAFLVWFGFQHKWSKTRFVLIVLLLALPEAIFWDWLQKRIRLREIRKHRRNCSPAAGLR
jgi:hypothetical protein